MQIFTEILKLILLPGFVLYAMYVTIRSFIQKDIEQTKNLHQTEIRLKEAEISLRQKEVELKNKEQMLPLRLQAYERMCLFLERISPAHLIPRMNNPNFSVGLLQQVLIQEIRNEFAHNLSQQIYMSDEAWLLIKKSVEESVLLINNSVLNLHEDAPGVELAKQILGNAHAHGIDPVGDALQYLKDEIRQNFF